MASLTEARQEIATALAGLPTITAATYAFVPSGASGLPLAFTMDPSSDVMGTTSNTQLITLTVVVLVADNDLELAQKRLDDLLTGPGSVVKALKADKTFNGTVIDSEVQGSRALNVVQMNQYQAWGHEWTMTLLMEA